MVGIVIASHSIKIAEGLKEVIEEMVPLTPIAAAGGTDDGRMGSSMGKILEAIEKVYSDDGVIILFDLGSAYMSAEMAVECFDEEKQKKIKIVDAALIEGGITAAVKSAIHKDINEIVDSLKSMYIGKMPER